MEDFCCTSAYDGEIWEGIFYSFFLQVWEVMGGGVMTEMLCVSRSVLVLKKKGNSPISCFP